MTTDAEGRVTNLRLYTINGNQPIGTSGTITSNGLRGRLPPELGNLAKLIWLHLNHNQLSGPIPDELGNLANLQNLEISSNELTGSIPAELGNLANLRDLRRLEWADTGGNLS